MGAYEALVNFVYHQFLRCHPFEVVVQAVIDPDDVQFRLAEQRLKDVRQHAFTVPYSGCKFTELSTMLETHSKTPESKLISYDHSVKG